VGVTRPVLWAGRQARKLPGGREFWSVSTAETSLPIAGVSTYPKCGTGQAAEKVHGVTAGNPISDQAGNCFATNSHRPGPRESPQLRADRRRLWQRHRHFREALPNLGLLYVVGIQSSVSVWKPRSRTPAQADNGKASDAPPSCYAAMASTIRLRTRVAMSYGLRWNTVQWREGTGKPLRSRFAALRPTSSHPTIGAANPAPRSGC